MCCAVSCRSRPSWRHTLLTAMMKKGESNSPGYVGGASSGRRQGKMCLVTKQTRANQLRLHIMHSKSAGLNRRVIQTDCRGGSVWRHQMPDWWSIASVCHESTYPDRLQFIRWIWQTKNSSPDFLRPKSHKTFFLPFEDAEPADLANFSPKSFLLS